MRRGTLVCREKISVSTKILCFVWEKNLVFREPNKVEKHCFRQREVTLFEFDFEGSHRFEVYIDVLNINIQKEKFYTQNLFNQGLLHNFPTNVCMKVFFVNILLSINLTFITCSKTTEEYTNEKNSN